MPIYEYRCQRCEERFEQLVPLRAEHPRDMSSLWYPGDTQTPLRVFDN